MEEREYLISGVKPDKLSKQLDKILKTTNKKLIRIKSWCKGCGICVEFCPNKALQMNEKTEKAELVFPEKCTSCGLCENLCPDFAIIITGIERTNLEVEPRDEVQPHVLGK